MKRGKEDKRGGGKDLTENLPQLKEEQIARRA